MCASKALARLLPGVTCAVMLGCLACEGSSGGLRNLPTAVAPGKANSGHWPGERVAVFTAGGRRCDALMGRLVDIAVRQDGQDIERFVALRQIRQVARSDSVRGEMLAPLLQYARDLRGVLDPYETVPAARALAAGGPAVEALACEELSVSLSKGDERFPFLCLTLALAERPGSKVTETLAELAMSRGREKPERRFLSLALAARRDHTKDWMEEVASAVRESASNADPRAATVSAAFMMCLVYAAPRLRATPALADALWRLVNSADSHTVPFLPLACYALLQPAPADPAVLAAIQDRIGGAPASETASVAVGHLAVAALGVDSGAHTDQALALVASHAYTTGDWYVLQIAGDTIVEARLLPYLSASLATGSRDVKLGGLRFVKMMGPYADSLLGPVGSLTPILGGEAGDVLRLVAGFDDKGEWLFPRTKAALRGGL